MFRSRNQLRRWAARMLVAWLCGVAIGVAHACFAPSFVGPGDSSAKAVAGGGAISQHVEHAHASHHAEPDGLLHQHESLAKSNCKDFCEKSAVSIPALKTAPDDLYGDALPPVAFAIVVALPAPSPDHLLLPRRDGGLAPPITIAFLRLAL